MYTVPFINGLLYLSLCVATIEYEAELRHKNEMKRLEAELKGKLVPPFPLSSSILIH